MSEKPKVVVLAKRTAAQKALLRRAHELALQGQREQHEFPWCSSWCGSDWCQMHGCQGQFSWLDA